MFGYYELDKLFQEFDFVDMMWWHEFDAEKTANIAGCSASDRLHLLIHDEKAKRKVSSFPA